MARCTAEEARQTRERLLDAALDVFWEQGVARPSLSLVAERAGLTRGAVYGHFCNRADLFSALCDRALLPVEALERIRAEGADEPLQALIDWYVFAVQEMTRNPARRKLLEIVYHKCELVEDTGDIRARMLQGRKAMTDHIRALLQSAVDKGHLPADIDIDVAEPLFTSAVTGTFTHWLMKPDDYDLPDLVPRFAASLVHMLTHAPTLRRQELP